MRHKHPLARFALAATLVLAFGAYNDGASAQTVQTGRDGRVYVLMRNPHTGRQYWQWLEALPEHQKVVVLRGIRDRLAADVARAQAQQWQRQAAQRQQQLQFEQFRDRWRNQMNDHILAPACR